MVLPNSELFVLVHIRQSTIYNRHSPETQNGSPRDCRGKATEELGACQRWPGESADRYLKANEALEWGLVSSHCSDIGGQSKGKYGQRKSEGKGMDPDGNGIDQVSESKNSRSHDQKEYNDGMPVGDRRWDIGDLRLCTFAAMINGIGCE